MKLGYCKYCGNIVEKTKMCKDCNRPSEYAINAFLGGISGLYLVLLFTHVLGVFPAIACGIFIVATFLFCKRSYKLFNSFLGNSVNSSLYIRREQVKILHGARSRLDLSESMIKKLIKCYKSNVARNFDSLSRQILLVTKFAVSGATSSALSGFQEFLLKKCDSFRDSCNFKMLDSRFVADKEEYLDKLRMLRTAIDGITEIYLSTRIPDGISDINDEINTLEMDELTAYHDSVREVTEC